MKKLIGSLSAVVVMTACGPTPEAEDVQPEVEVPSLEDTAMQADALTCTYGANGGVLPVSSAGRLDDVLASATCGKEVVLASGTYGGSYLFNKSCEGRAPIVIRSQTAFGAVLTGTLNLKGSNVVVTGLKIDSGGEIHIQSKRARITRNLILSAGSMTLSDGAVGNRIDHNEFRDTYNTGAGTNHDIVFNLRPDDAVTVSGNRVDHNLFRGTRDLDIMEGVSMYVGTYDLNTRFGIVYNTNTVIERNLWTNWRKKSSMEAKSSRLTFRNNVVAGGRNFAKVINRNGSFSTFSGNNLEGTGLFIYDNDNTLVGNRVTGRIRIMAEGRTGTVQEAEEGKKLRLGAHNARVIGNQGKLVLGDDEGGVLDLEPVRNVLVERHTRPADIERVPGLTANLTVRDTTTTAVPPVASFGPTAVGVNASSACGQ